MKKYIIVIILSLLFALIQSSFDFGIFRINLLFLFLIYLLFFYDANYALMVLPGVLLLDFFSINFGAYFLALFVMFIFVYYIYHNVFSDNKFIVYIGLNFLGLIIFYIIYYIFNLLIKFLKLGFYIFDFHFIFKEFFLSIIFNLLITSILYILSNFLSYKFKNRLIIIRD